MRPFTLLCTWLDLLPLVMCSLPCWSFASFKAFGIQCHPMTAPTIKEILGLPLIMCELNVTMMVLLVLLLVGVFFGIIGQPPQGSLFCLLRLLMLSMLSLSELLKCFTQSNFILYIIKRYFFLGITLVFLIIYFND